MSWRASTVRAAAPVPLLLLGLLSVLLFGLLPSGCARRGEPPGPNVVILSIDGLRPDHLRCYGYGRNTSPFIDAFARGGAVFEEHVSSAPDALPAHASLVTGTPTSLHGLVDGGADPLSPRLETLAESFRAQGYATGGFFGTPALGVASGLGRGFERYVGCGPASSPGADPGRGGSTSISTGSSAASSAVPSAALTGASTTGASVRQAWADFLEAAAPGARARRAPIFAVLTLPDVCPDFVPPAPFDRIFDPDYVGPVTGRNVMADRSIGPGMEPDDRHNLIARLDGEIRWVDSLVGQVHEDLVGAGLIDDTIVVITSAHGMELFEHGGKGPGTTLLDEQIRVPLIVWYPKAVPRGRHRTLTRTIDVAPSLLDLAGLPAMPSSMGESFSAIATGEVDTRRQFLAISELMTGGRELRSLRSRSDKLIHSAADDSFLRYDLVLDPGEMEARPVGNDARSQALLEQYRGAVAEMAEARRKLGLGAPRSPALARSLEPLGPTEAIGR